MRGMNFPQAMLHIMIVLADGGWLSGEVPGGPSAVFLALVVSPVFRFIAGGVISRVRAMQHALLIMGFLNQGSILGVLQPAALLQAFLIFAFGLLLSFVILFHPLPMLQAVHHRSIQAGHAACVSATCHQHN